MSDRRPLVVRLLRLRHVRPTTWQRALLGDSSVVLAVLLVLADVATAWTLVVLPLAVALLVKAHDLLAGRLVAGAHRHFAGGPNERGPNERGPHEGDPSRRELQRPAV